MQEPKNVTIRLVNIVKLEFLTIQLPCFNKLKKFFKLKVKKLK